MVCKAALCSLVYYMLLCGRDYSCASASWTVQFMHVKQYFLWLKCKKKSW